MLYRVTDYSNKIINGKPSIWLQNYGWAEAKPANEFKIGEFMRWNGGSSSKLVEIVRRTAKTITFKEEYKAYRGGYETGERTVKADRWIAIGSETSYIRLRY